MEAIFVSVMGGTVAESTAGGVLWAAAAFGVALGSRPAPVRGL